jgi:hypothetical protein
MDDPNTKAKAEWRENFRVKLESLARAEMDGVLTPDEARHSVYRVSEVHSYLKCFRSICEYDKIHRDWSRF